MILILNRISINLLKKRLGAIYHKNVVYTIYVQSIVRSRLLFFHKLNFMGLFHFVYLILNYSSPENLHFIPRKKNREQIIKFAK